jgi:ATP-dependent exoDNAse (exonuclease V) beta subunit
MMTGHKSKGLEFHEVFILDRELIRMDRQQDQNLLYVMQTRSKERLTYITSDAFVASIGE